MANRRNPVSEPETKVIPNLAEDIAGVTLCAGCGTALNVPHITNEKGSYHGVACYNKVN